MKISLMERAGLALILLLAPVAPAHAQMHGAGPVEIPVRFENGRLLVPVKAADGTEMEFMLSTGTPPTVLAASTAARLGETPTLTLGGLPVSVENLVTTPDESLTVDGKLIPGMIGPTTFTDYDLLIDVPNGRLVAKPFGRRVEWDGMEMSDPIPLRVFHGVIISLDVELNDQPYMATLDLGLSTIVVNQPVKERFDLQDSDVARLAVGGLSFADLEVRVRDLQTFAQWDPDNRGFVMVGAPMVADCAVSISWVHQEMRTCVR